MRIPRFMVLLTLALSVVACGPERPLAPVAPPDAMPYQPGSNPQIDALIAREEAAPPAFDQLSPATYYIVV